MINLTNTERLMYAAMTAIANIDAPIVFKGAMITKLILDENRFDEFVRETRDVDASWVGETLPTLEQMTATLNRALNPLTLKAEAVRDYGPNTSSSFDITDIASNELKLTIFLEPFITPSLMNHVWECESGRWTVVPVKSFPAKLENGKLLSSVHSGNIAAELRRSTEHKIGD
jgi:hypothetical protein